jgi:hypothetical protein
MGHKRRLSPHQKQIRFLTVFFGAIMVGTVIALLVFFNRLPAATH